MAQDSLHVQYQQKLPRRISNPLPHQGIRNRMEAADQVKMGCGGRAFGHRKEGIPHTSTDVRSLGNNS